MLTVAQVIATMYQPRGIRPVIVSCQRRFCSSIGLLGSARRLMSRQSSRRLVSVSIGGMYGADPPIKYNRSAEPRFVDAFEIAPVIGPGIAIGRESALAMGYLRGLG